jgi:hypothetical protein
MRWRSESETVVGDGCVAGIKQTGGSRLIPFLILTAHQTVETF